MKIRKFIADFPVCVSRQYVYVVSLELHGIVLMHERVSNVHRIHSDLFAKIYSSREQVFGAAIGNARHVRITRVPTQKTLISI